MQTASLGLGGFKGCSRSSDRLSLSLATTSGQQATLCGEPVCLQRARSGQRNRLRAVVLDSAVLSKEEARTHQQWPAGPKGIKNNAIELVGNTPMVGLHEEAAVDGVFVVHTRASCTMAACSSVNSCCMLLCLMFHIAGHHKI